MKKKMAPRRATGRKLERHKVELQEVFFAEIQSISEKMYTFDAARWSRKNLSKIKFFTSGKKSLLWDTSNDVLFSKGIANGAQTGFLL